MIKINSEASEKLEYLGNNYYVVADFDKTISTADSNTTLSLFSKSGLYDSEYSKRRDDNYKYYRPLEVDPSISYEEKFALMKEWAEESMRLIVEYKMREDDIKTIIKRNDLIELRDGAIEFIKLLNRNNIPLIISSAGCGDFITELLKLYNVLDDNVFVFSNFFKFENGLVVGTKGSLVHSMNKCDITLPDGVMDLIKDKYQILIGDHLSDLAMGKKLDKIDSISFGFLESNVLENERLFNESFDVVLKDNESFDAISKMLRLK